MFVYQKFPIAFHYLQRLKVCDLIYLKKSVKTSVSFSYIFYSNQYMLLGINLSTIPCLLFSTKFSFVNMATLARTEVNCEIKIMVWDAMGNPLE